ncbi:MAG: acyl--CoA ligase [Deltaproteobacteria bacterium]|nr:acyl--CoA ligase [Deltaproteobacteria bacterium]
MLDLARLSREFGSRPAIIEPDAETTYADLVKLVSTQASWLEGVGMASGDRVSLVCDEDRATVVRALALLECGCAVMPLSAQFGADERRQAQAAFGAQWTANAVGPVERAVASGEAAPGGEMTFAEPPVLGMLSSGSTGTPKVGLKSASQLRAYAAIYVEGLSLTPADRVAVLLPFSFTYGFNSVMLGTLSAGASLVFPGSRHPRKVMAAISAQGVTILGSTPTFLDLMVRFSEGVTDQLAAVRVCVATGEPLSQRIALRFAETFGKTLWNNYGSSEAGPITVDRQNTAHGDAIALGRPYTGVEVTLRDEQDRLVPDGEIGEIVVRSPATGLGYASGQEGSRPFDGDRFFTGDLGVLRDGALYFAGRRKLLLNTAGRKVDPSEVEHILLQHPQVTDAAVVGHRDGDREVVRAVVVAEGALTAGELMGFCNESLAAYKVPRIVEFRTSLPRNDTGKLMRTAL